MTTINPLSTPDNGSAAHSAAMRGRTVSSDPTTGKTVISIAALPADVQGYMKEFDIDNSGLICTSDLTNIARQHRDLKTSSELFKKVLIILVVLMMIVLLISFGLSFAVYELTKDIAPDSDGNLRTYDGTSGLGDTVLKTGNSDMSVANGILDDRVTGLPLKTSSDLTMMDGSWLSSSVPNSLLDGMEDFIIGHGEALLKLDITGFMRALSDENPTDLAKSEVTLFTSKGEIYLTGEKILLSSEVASLVTAIGVTVEEGIDVNGRKLLWFSGASYVLGVAIGVGVTVGVAAVACTTFPPSCVAGAAAVSGISKTAGVAAVVGGK